ncbi:MAG: AEC family transporter [Dichotomicrobium sp.]
MLTTLNAVAPIFLVILTGTLLKRIKLVPAEMWPIVEHICFYLLMPFLIIRTLARADLGAIPIADFAIVIAGGVIGMASLLLLLRPVTERRFGISGPSFTSIFQGATRFHGFMALAIVGSLYGEEGVALSGIAIGVMVPLINMLNVAILTIFGNAEARPDWTRVLLKIISNPLIVACVIGFALNITGIPGFIYGAIDIIGDGGLGLALLAVGAGLSAGRALETKLLVSAGVLIRLLGMPLLVVLLSWVVGLEGITRTVAIITGAVPTASSAYVMARQMGGDADLMANITTMQVLLAAITLPLFIFIAENI